MPIKINYRYTLSNDQTGVKDQEKMAQRSFEICKPESYKGLISKEGQLDTDKCWIINGIIDKVDGNFIMNKFKINTISDVGLSFGGYPASEKDFRALDQQGVKTIINLMSDEEMNLRDLKLDQIQVNCNRNQVKYIRIPIKDQLEDGYCFELFSAAKELNRLVIPGSHVYLHCSSGVTRSPTLALVFLCMFKRVESWK
jgi:protein tyrosine phosphatase (PTP) superfamily phosphohydrolase (DUF442 family)